LRLEVDKRKRGEAEWLKILVALLDHVHALHQAGVRSGQTKVIQQLGSFQAACRDVVRRVGLVPLEAQPGEPFNPASHRLPDESQQVPEGAVIAATLATGFTFQGQLVRQVMVTIEEPGTTAPATAVAESMADADPTPVDEDDPVLRSMGELGKLSTDLEQDDETLGQS
jgi:hypothetical protein